jgi:pyroglutamyl-peptidase
VLAVVSCGNRHVARDTDLEPQPTVLLTGFEPFAGLQTNTSWEVARRLDRQVVEGRRVVSVLLPVAWEEARSQLAAAVHAQEPDVAIVMGVAWWGLIAVESPGRNVRGAHLDNRKRLPPRREIYADGPPALDSRLPRKRIVERLTEMDIPARLSDTAGDYLCNEVLYTVLYETRERGIPAGLLHMPRAGPDRARRALRAEEQVRRVTVDELVAAVREVIAITVRRPRTELKSPVPSLPAGR